MIYVIDLSIKHKTDQILLRLHIGNTKIAQKNNFELTKKNPQTNQNQLIKIVFNLYKTKQMNLTVLFKFADSLYFSDLLR